MKEGVERRIVNNTNVLTNGHFGCFLLQREH